MQNYLEEEDCFNLSLLSFFGYIGFRLLTEKGKTSFNGTQIVISNRFGSDH